MNVKLKSGSDSPESFPLEHWGFNWFKSLKRIPVHSRETRVGHTNTQSGKAQNTLNTDAFAEND